jgi:hypothetical protein
MAKGKSTKYAITEEQLSKLSVQLEAAQGCCGARLFVAGSRVQEQDREMQQLGFTLDLAQQQIERIGEDLLAAARSAG